MYALKYSFVSLYTWLYGDWLLEVGNRNNVNKLCVSPCNVYNGAQIGEWGIITLTFVPSLVTALIPHVGRGDVAMKLRAGH